MGLIPEIAAGNQSYGHLGGCTLFSLGTSAHFTLLAILNAPFGMVSAHSAFIHVSYKLTR